MHKLQLTHPKQNQKYASNCKKSTLEMSKRIKTILSVSWEINLPGVLDEENKQFHFVRSFSVV